MKSKFIFVAIMFISILARANEYASFKYDEVNLRTGPGERYPIMWIYQEKNFPVEVLDSFELWREIREKDGTIGWVHQNMLKKTRYLLVEKEGALFKKADPESGAVAVVQPGVIARLEECPKGEYCYIAVSDENHTKKGWFPRSSLWGVAADEIVEK